MTLTATRPRLTFSAVAKFYPKQWEATRAADTHTYTLFGGSRGPGKSYWLRWYAVRLLLQWAKRGFRGVRVMLASENYPALYERHVSKIQLEFPAWLGTYKGDRNEFVLRPEYGGGAIALRNLDDPTKYQSSEYAAMLIDELTKNPMSTFNVLRGSLRWPGIQDVRFAAASNPDGRYSRWVRQLWIERDFPEELKPLADQFIFVAALPYDNPALSDNYWHMLKTLPSALRQAWLEGNWFVAHEGLVYPEFGADNLTEYAPDPKLPVELAFDDGYVDPRAILFIQRTSTRVYVFDEIYQSRRLGEQSVQAVRDRMAQWFGEVEGQPAKLPEIAIGSPEAVELHKHFRRADIVARAVPHKVVEGIKVVRQLIRDGNGYCTLQVSPRCRNFIDELTSGYQYPPEGSRGDDEKPLDGNDHAADAFRYWAWVRGRQ